MARLVRQDKSIPQVRVQLDAFSQAVCLTRWAEEHLAASNEVAYCLAARGQFKAAESVAKCGRILSRSAEEEFYKPTHYCRSKYCPVCAGFIARSVGGDFIARLPKTSTYVIRKYVLHLGEYVGRRKAAEQLQFIKSYLSSLPSLLRANNHRLGSIKSLPEYRRVFGKRPAVHSMVAGVHVAMYENHVGPPTCYRPHLHILLAADGSLSEDYFRHKLQAACDRDNPFDAFLISSTLGRILDTSANSKQRANSASDKSHSFCNTKDLLNAVAYAVRCHPADRVTDEFAAREKLLDEAGIKVSYRRHVVGFGREDSSGGPLPSRLSLPHRYDPVALGHSKLVLIGEDSVFQTTPVPCTRANYQVLDRKLQKFVNEMLGTTADY